MRIELATVLNADRIMDIGTKGEIIAQGTHSWIAESCGCINAWPIYSLVKHGFKRRLKDSLNCLFISAGLIHDEELHLPIKTPR